MTSKTLEISQQDEGVLGQQEDVVADQEEYLLASRLSATGIASAAPRAARAAAGGAPRGSAAGGAPRVADAVGASRACGAVRGLLWEKGLWKVLLGTGLWWKGLQEWR
jgi:hypothetical protein